MSSGAFGPNEERYRKASEPHETEEAATSAIDSFFNELSALREKHKVAEVVIVAAVYYGDTDSKKALAHAANFGNPAVAPELAAAAYGQHTAPVVARAEMLERAARSKRKNGK